jgi:nitrogen fixation/metabolism regulation signal transduction histidine kinase
MASSDVPELTISTAVEDDDMVAVDVADIGSRIAPERMSQLFQPFVTETAWDGGRSVDLSYDRRGARVVGLQSKAIPAA